MCPAIVIWLDPWRWDWPNYAFLISGNTSALVFWWLVGPLFWPYFLFQTVSVTPTLLLPLSLSWLPPPLLLLPLLLLVVLPLLLLLLLLLPVKCHQNGTQGSTHGIAQLDQTEGGRVPSWSQQCLCACHMHLSILAQLLPASGYWLLPGVRHGQRPHRQRKDQGLEGDQALAIQARGTALLTLRRHFVQPSAPRMQPLLGLQRH
jgi:hypothetical protein